MRIVVVEPHADDAFLSLGGHIETLWKDHEITIVTVFSNKRRGAEAAAYAKAVGAQSIQLGLEGAGMASEAPVRPVRALQKCLASITWDEVYVPVGLQHPDHRAVAISLTPTGSYMDVPYCAKLKNQDSLRSDLVGETILSVHFPSKRKWRHAKLFKSQSKFFHFNPMDTTRIPEVIIQK